MRKSNFFIFICFYMSTTLCSPLLASSPPMDYVIESEINKSSSDESIASTKNSEEAILDSYNNIVTNIIINRNNCIKNFDSEGLKSSYNLKIKVSLWAYESEAQKMKYLQSWCEKQGVKFDKIESTVKVRKVKEKEKDLFGILCYNSTAFTYSYLDEPDVPNTFYLGTSHYINLKKEGENYIITKEWYTDPFADSLHINSKKTDEIKNYITGHKAPDYTPDERTQKAIDYAHKYCGVSPDNLFKYNKDYKNFNPDGGDCANFASQILHEGGGFKKNGTWNYNHRSGSKAWVNAQGFKNYIVGSGKGGCICKGTYQEVYKGAYQLRPGDFVAYEKKGKITHISTVTGLDSKGYPLVTCHNTDRLLVPYDLGWSDKGIRFHFIDVYY